MTDESLFPCDYCGRRFAPRDEYHDWFGGKLACSDCAERIEADEAEAEAAPVPARYSYRQRLGLIYARVVGYDLAAESPSLPIDYIANALREVMAEHVAAGGSARGADEREVIQ